MGNGIRLGNQVINQFGAPSINENTLANRPAAGQAGRLFVDTTNNLLQRDTGSAYVTIGAVSATPDLQAVCTVGSTFTSDITISTIRIGRGGPTVNAENTAVGFSSLSSINNSFGNYNVAVGYGCMDSATSSNSNTCIGYNAGTAITSATTNVIIGSRAGDTNMTNQSSCVFIGADAGRYTGGFGNICIGYQTDTQQSIGNFAGTQNTYIGYGIGVNVNSYTSYNVFIGTTTGSGYTGNGINGLNTFIGSLLSLSASPTITGNIIIGNNTGKKIQNYASGNWVLGGGADNGIHQLQLSGGLYCQTISPSGVTFAVNTTITLGSSNFYYVFTGAIGATITLPTASANNNMYTFINSTSVSFTVSTSGGQFILNKFIGSLTTTVTVGNYACTILIADGDNKFYQLIS